MANLPSYVFIVLSAAGLLAFPAHVTAQPAECSTVAQADGVIAATSPVSNLVLAVRQSVPTDPANCVPSFCEASKNEPTDVQVAVGAGLSEAYLELITTGKDTAALALLGSACSAACEEVVLTSFAVSQASSVPRLCETDAGHIRAEVGAILEVEANGGGGGASRN